ncbi:MAG: hypothetical protein AAF850_08360 [Pseudomonadota bacterium]
MALTHQLFDTLVALHITTGAPGLISFWAPIVTKKGANLHRFWGKFFTISMIATGCFALGMSTLSILFPMTTHPHLVDHPEFSDPELIAGIFGHMMFFLAILTINLAWYGWSCVKNRGDHQKNRAWHILTLQVLLTAAAINCVAHGVRLGQPMMIGITTIGFATVATNMWFIAKVKPRPVDWLLEHIKALIGTGISVYTAFFAFGAVRMMPELALTPALWSVPLVTGLGLILYHQRSVTRQFRRPRMATPKPAAAE